MKFVLAAVFSFAALTASASAEDALPLYQSGQYTDAIRVGLHQNTGESIAVAARAALAIAAQRTPCLECLTLAENLARKSIVADPKLADAHVFLAVSLGYKARIEGVVHARLSGYADEAKRNLDQALQSDPKNGWALAALGGWNIEIQRKGGVYLARWLYGASLDGGMKDFAAAFAAAPDNPVLCYQYALSLAGLDLAEWEGQIKDALTRASTMKSRTAYEKFAQARAKELLAVLSKNDLGAFDRLVKHDQGYP